MQIKKVVRWLFGEYKEKREGFMRKGQMGLSLVAGKEKSSILKKRIDVDVFAAFGRRPRLLDLSCYVGGTGVEYK
jgi:hypothetical protein